MQHDAAQAATVLLDRVYHVGTFKAAHKGLQMPESQEGNGLSISVNPHEWAEIARLGGGRLWQLDKKGGLFLDYHQMDATLVVLIRNWSLQYGWAQQEKRWRIEWEDCETEELTYMLVDSHAAALEEISFMEEAASGPTEVEVLCTTESLSRRVGFAVDPLSVPDILSTLWVEDCTDWDGVWWADTLAPESLSAPRGVINLKSLPSWSVIDLGPI
jgi:hypothetical protein